jgi:hypothetical protein
VTYATNHVLVAEPVVCGTSAGGSTTNAPGLYQGIGKMQFVRTSYDSLLGQFYQPITNTYTEVLMVDHQPLLETLQRVVTAPDFLISAADQAAGPSAPPPGSIASRNIKFNPANIQTNLDGPGTIDPSSTITFSKAGTLFENTASGDQTTEVQELLWGSFDGSTNDPVVYPNGASLANLANQVLVQISPSTLPTGTNGVVYPATNFIATGGPFKPPFTWSVSSSGMPPGLTLSSTGMVSGKPTQPGIFDIIVLMTDSLTNSVSWSYPITIQ